MSSNAINPNATVKDLRETLFKQCGITLPEEFPFVNELASFLIMKLTKLQRYEQMIKMFAAWPVEICNPIMERYDLDIMNPRDIHINLLTWAIGNAELKAISFIINRPHLWDDRYLNHFHSALNARNKDVALAFLSHERFMHEIVSNPEIRSCAIELLGLETFTNEYERLVKLGLDELSPCESGTLRRMKGDPEIKAYFLKRARDVSGWTLPDSLADPYLFLRVFEGQGGNISDMITVLNDADGGYVETLRVVLGHPDFKPEMLSEGLPETTVIEHPDGSRRTEFSHACVEGYREIVKLFLTVKGLDSNCIIHGFYQASLLGETEIAKLFGRIWNKMTPSTNSSELENAYYRGKVEEKMNIKLTESFTLCKALYDAGCLLTCVENSLVKGDIVTLKIFREEGFGHFDHYVRASMSKCGNIEVLKFILDNNFADVLSYHAYVINQLWQSDRREYVDFMLNHPSINIDQLKDKCTSAVLAYIKKRYPPKLTDEMIKDATKRLTELGVDDPSVDMIRCFHIGLASAK